MLALTRAAHSSSVCLPFVNVRVTLDCARRAAPADHHLQGDGHAALPRSDPRAHRGAAPLSALPAESETPRGRNAYLRRTRHAEMHMREALRAEACRRPFLPRRVSPLQAGNMVVPLHAYPAIDPTQLPTRVDFGFVALGRCAGLSAHSRASCISPNRMHLPEPHASPRTACISPNRMYLPEPHASPMRALERRFSAALSTDCVVAPLPLSKTLALPPWPSCLRNALRVRRGWSRQLEARLRNTSNTLHPQATRSCVLSTAHVSSKQRLDN
eukprot:2512722-Pleurochrysis_carterae.AAC.3